MIAAARGRRAALAVMLVLVGAAGAQEAPPPPPPFSWEASAGHESLSSPVIRVDPNSALILIDGHTKLRGAYGRVAGSLFGEWSPGGEATLVGSARLDVKSAPRARDLDFSMAQVDATLRHPFAGASLGVGPTASHIRVAGERFRTGAGLRADLATGDGAGGHWAVVVDGGRQRHGPGYEELDARVASASFHRRVAHPVAGLEALDLEAGLSRTANRYGYEDLSNRGAFARLALEAKRAGFGLLAAVSVQHARFDASALEEYAARRDRFVLVEIGVVKEVSKETTVRADFAWGRNKANVAIYDNRLRAFSLTVLSGF